MSEKLVAIHSQGNWAGVSVDFVVVPGETDMMELYDIHSSQSYERGFSEFIIDTVRGRYANGDDIELFAEGTDAIVSVAAIKSPNGVYTKSYVQGFLAGTVLTGLAAALVSIAVGRILENYL